MYIVCLNLNSFPLLFRLEHILLHFFLFHYSPKKHATLILQYYDQAFLEQIYKEAWEQCLCEHRIYDTIQYKSI